MSKVLQFNHQMLAPPEIFRILHALIIAHPYFWLKKFSFRSFAHVAIPWNAWTCVAFLRNCGCISCRQFQ
eukprot:s443_g33.t1